MDCSCGLWPPPTNKHCISQLDLFTFQSMSFDFAGAFAQQSMGLQGDSLLLATFDCPLHFICIKHMHDWDAGPFVRHFIAKLAPRE